MKHRRSVTINWLGSVLGLLFLLVQPWEARGQRLLADRELECSATINYGATLGLQPNSDIPIFFASFSILTHSTKVNLSRWALGWRFTAGERINEAKDVYGIGGDSPYNVTVLNQSPPYGAIAYMNSTLMSSLDEKMINFVGRKGPKEVESRAPFRIGPPEKVYLNNNFCKMIRREVNDSQGPTIAAEAQPILPTTPRTLEVQYTPIEYLDENGVNPLFAASFTQFYLRLTSRAPSRSIPLDKINIQYWFNGPDDRLTSGNYPDEGPMAKFKLYCNDVTPEIGCDNLIWNFTEGLGNVKGAQYVLNLSFKRDVGFLLPDDRTDPIIESLLARSNNTAFFDVEMIVSIEPRRYFTQINQTLDYSYMDTPKQPNRTTNATARVVLRKKEPNPRVPVFVNGILSWGSPPRAGEQLNMSNPSQGGLPHGSYCQTGVEGGLMCGVSVVYCCQNNPYRDVAEVDWEAQLNTFTQDPGGRSTAVGAIGPSGQTQKKKEPNNLPIIVGVVVSAAVVGLGLAGFFVMRSRWRGGRRGAPGVPLSTIVGRFLRRGGHDDGGDSDGGGEFAQIMSFVPSMMGGKARRNLTLEEQDLLERTPLLDPIAQQGTKFQTMPVTTFMSTLDCEWQTTEKPKIVQRKHETWTGRIHESWELIPSYLSQLERRRTVGLPPSYQCLPPPFPPALSMSNTSCIALDVDYKTEIEPFLGQLLGRGGYGSVYEAEWRGQKVAVKLLSVDTQQDVYEAFMKEVELSSRFRHCDRVVRLLGASFSDRLHVGLIMELVEGGNLAERIYAPNKRRLDYLEILQIGYDIACGLAYLHPCVIHRDLKPQNVLLDRHGRAKIADFGISRFKDPHRSYLSVTHQGGTPNYMAPELFNGTRVDDKCDVYSLGCILYECVARKSPFSEMASHKSYNILYKIIVAVAINGLRPDIPDDCPPTLREIIQMCWMENPKERPGCAELAERFDRLIQDEVRVRTQRAGYKWRLKRNASAGQLSVGSVSFGGSCEEEVHNEIGSGGHHSRACSLGRVDQIEETEEEGILESNALVSGGTSSVGGVDRDPLGSKGRLDLSKSAMALLARLQDGYLKDRQSQGGDHPENRVSSWVSDPFPDRRTPENHQGKVTPPARSMSSAEADAKNDVVIQIVDGAPACAPPKRTVSAPTYSTSAVQPERPDRNNTTFTFYEGQHSDLIRTTTPTINCMADEINQDLAPASSLGTSIEGPAGCWGLSIDIGGLSSPQDSSGSSKHFSASPNLQSSLKLNWSGVSRLDSSTSTTDRPKRSTLPTDSPRDGRIIELDVSPTSSMRFNGYRENSMQGSSPQQASAPGMRMNGLVSPFTQVANAVLEGPDESGSASTEDFSRSRNSSFFSMQTLDVADLPDPFLGSDSSRSFQSPVEAPAQDGQGLSHVARSPPVERPALIHKHQRQERPSGNFSSIAGITSFSFDLDSMGSQEDTSEFWESGRLPPPTPAPNEGRKKP